MCMCVCVGGGVTNICHKSSGGGRDFFFQWDWGRGFVKNFVHHMIMSLRWAHSHFVGGLSYRGSNSLCNC